MKLNKIKLKNKIYDFLKWFSILFIPASAWFVGTIFETWNIKHVDEIVRTINATGTFIGILLGISNYNYYKGDDKDVKGV